MATDVISMAENKLRGAEESSKGPEDRALLACISLRVIVNFALTPEANAEESLLIEQYMRVALVVPTHRHYIYAGAPSEPILSEVAGRILSTSSKDSWFRILALSYERHFLTKGEQGEMLSRVLWIKAHDQALIAKFRD
jgi:hypothetical protein